MVFQIILDPTELGGMPEFLARYGAAAAAALFPAGFFLSSASRDAVGGVGAKGLGEPGPSAGGGCAQPALSAQ